jgi:hypothetical protein
MSTAHGDEDEVLFRLSRRSQLALWTFALAVGAVLAIAWWSSGIHQHGPWDDLVVTAVATYVALTCWAVGRRRLVVQDGVLHNTGFVRSYRVDLSDLRRAILEENAWWLRIELRNGTTKAVTAVTPYSTCAWRWRPDERTLAIVARLEVLARESGERGGK